MKVLTLALAWLAVCGEVFGGCLGNLAEHKQLSVMIQVTESDKKWHPIHVQWDATGDKLRYFLSVQKLDTPRVRTGNNDPFGGDGDPSPSYSPMKEETGEFPIKDFFTALVEAEEGLSVYDEGAASQDAPIDAGIRLEGGGVTCEWAFSSQKSAAAYKACRKAYSLAVSSLSDDQKAELKNGVTGFGPETSKDNQGKWTACLFRAYPKTRSLTISRGLIGKKSTYASASHVFGSKDLTEKIEGPRDLASLATPMMRDLRIPGGPLGEPTIQVDLSNCFSVILQSCCYSQRIDVNPDVQARPQLAKFISTSISEMERYVTSDQKKKFEAP